METIDTIDEVDINPFVLTTYQINDYVLRRYPPTKIGGGNPHKYGSWWARHKTIQASRFVLSTLKPMERISIDTIGLYLRTLNILL